jgi:hypothetical protein
MRKQRPRRIASALRPRPNAVLMSRKWDANFLKP